MTLFTYCLFSFLCTGITFAFFKSLGKTRSLRQFLNNKESGFITAGPENL